LNTLDRIPVSLLQGEGWGHGSSIPVGPDETLIGGSMLTLPFELSYLTFDLLDPALKRIINLSSLGRVH